MTARHARIVALTAIIGFSIPAFSEGVNVCEPSKLRNLVPAKQVEQSVTQQYSQMLKEAELSAPWRTTITRSSSVRAPLPTS
jgi:hypothetical protein